MTKIYIVRHCEAEGNAKRLFQGTTDCDISEIGRKQLEFLTSRFSDIEIDRVYSSPLIRASKTAHAIADSKNLPVILNNGLKELYGGVVEGKLFVEAFTAIPGLADIWLNRPQDFEPEGGETMRHAYQRIWNSITEIVKENKDKTIAAATHGGVIRNLLCRLIYGDIEQLKEIGWSENTAVTLIEFQDDMKYKIVFCNDHSHLPEEYLPKRSRISQISGSAK